MKRRNRGKTDRETRGPAAHDPKYRLAEHTTTRYQTPPSHAPKPPQTYALNPPSHHASYPVTGRSDHLSSDLSKYTSVILFVTRRARLSGILARRVGGNGAFKTTLAKKHLKWVTRYLICSAGCISRCY